jgi:hypothetical protein
VSARHDVRAAAAVVLVAAALAAPLAPRPAAAQGTPRALLAAVPPSGAPAAPVGPAGALPASSLAVSDDASGRPWWTSADAPTRWDGRAPVLDAAVRWRPAATPGVEWGELTLRGSGEAWRTRLVVVRLDPARVALRLDTAFAARGRPAWTIDRAPESAAVAVNAGQFVSSMPWGWVVLDGRQFLEPQHGPLASAVVVDSSGTVRWLHGAAVAAPDARRGARWAFQSYPTLLVAGEVPAPLQGAGGGVDVGHRDARAALGHDASGRLLVALTRFDGLGGALGFVPLGLTAPEMAAVMGALGCRDAVMLDGGISAQLHLRAADGGARRWSGLRAVPLALVAGPRAP